MSNRFPVDRRTARGSTFHAMIVTPIPNGIDYTSIDRQNLRGDKQ